MKNSMKLKFVFVLGAFIFSGLAMGSSSMLGNATIANTTSTTKSSALPVIHFSTGVQTANTLQQMIDNFNANFSTTYGFTVELDQSTWATNSQHDTYVADFQAHSTDLDVISMDVIWPAEFASAGYIVPLNEVFNSSYQSQFLSAPIQAGTVNVNGTTSIYGVPWFHDSAVLYFRSDILQYAVANNIITDPGALPPATWAQLDNWSVAMMKNSALVSKFNLTAGFVWQGKSYEGLMCDFMEYIGGTGTYSFLNSAGNASIFQTSAGISAALTYMKGLITDGASPSAVLTYDEEGSLAVWNAGSAIFMRNWPYAYALSLGSTNLNGSLVTGTNHNVQQFNVTTMPAENSSVVDPRTSCLGGWQLGVSAYSTHPDFAKKFIMWITDYQNQLYYFLGNGETPTLKAVYNDPAILSSKQAYVHNYLPLFEAALPRPVSPLYTQMSAKIAPIINNYLGGGVSLSDALSQLNSAVSDVINPPKASGYEAPVSIMLIVFGLGTIVTIRKRKLKQN